MAAAVVAKDAAMAEGMGCRRSIPARKKGDLLSRGVGDRCQRKKVWRCHVLMEWKEETRLWVQKRRQRLPWKRLRVAVAAAGRSGGRVTVDEDGDGGRLAARGLAPDARLRVLNGHRAGNRACEVGVGGDDELGVQGRVTLAGGRPTSFRRLRPRSPPSPRTTRAERGVSRPRPELAGEDGAGSGGNFPVGITGSAHAAVCDEEEGGVGGLQRWIEGGWRERSWKKKKIVALFLSGNRASQESTSGCGCSQQWQNRQLIGAWFTDLVGSVRGVGDRVRQRMKSGEKSAPAAASGLEDDVAAVGKQGKGRSRLGGSTEDRGWRRGAGCGQRLLWRIHRSPRARRRRRWWSNASAAVSSVTSQKRGLCSKCHRDLCLKELPEMLAAEAEIWKVTTAAASSAVGKGHGARLTARGLRRWFGRWLTEEEYFAEESIGGGSRKAMIP
ncbi:hypothetical protein GW17_00007437 [Ensete ventricosum]|nr:hypothetical protein GW17_00007437 [Ensete ventricosum]